VGKPEAKRAHGRQRLRWEDNIKMDLKRRKFEGVNWDSSGLEQGPVSGSCEHGDEPSASMIGGGFLN
jgi:hypothetical protein